ncbi:hypothetical protein J1N35_034179 [Gossypium stocksii]|uniref:A20-type domain-containing protein n=1 Tax=Gossypium stocksii TaxID=47602 RepID=A0A9D3USE6_9ROSI|nr:hypothetical protein J1N35_034179 [Gossypium stocksii]
MAEEHRCQAPEGHRLCVNKCGFLGNSVTMNLCSKCYRDFRLKEQQQASSGKSSISTSPSSSSTAVESVSQHSRIDSSARLVQALEKYKYEQSLDHTSEFIEKLEKELEEYLEHKARYHKAKESEPQDFAETNLPKKIYPSRLNSMSILPNSSSSEVDSTLSLTALFTHGRLAKLELEDGNSLYAKLVVIELAPV